MNYIEFIQKANNIFHELSEIRVNPNKEYSYTAKKIWRFLSEYDLNTYQISNILYNAKENLINIKHSEYCNDDDVFENLENIAKISKLNFYKTIEVLQAKHINWCKTNKDKLKDKSIIQIKEHFGDVVNYYILEGLR